MYITTNGELVNFHSLSPSNKVVVEQQLGLDDGYEKG